MNDGVNEFKTKNNNDDERLDKKRRYLTDAAKEKHRTTNRLVSQRARARIKHEVDTLRKDNTILQAQNDRMKSALLAIASPDYCNEVFEQCDKIKQDLSIGGTSSVASLSLSSQTEDIEDSMILKVSV